MFVPPSLAAAAIDQMLSSFTLVLSECDCWKLARLLIVLPAGAPPPPPLADAKLEEVRLLKLLPEDAVIDCYGMMC